MRPTLERNLALEDEETARLNTDVLTKLAEAHQAEPPPPDASPQEAPAWQEPEANVLGMVLMGVLIAFGLVFALGIIERDMPPRHVPLGGPTPEAITQEALGARIAVARVERAAERRAHPERFLVVRDGWRWAVGKDGTDKVLGTVYNGSLRTATAWRATVFYHDVTGRVLAAHSSYAIDPLLPGGSHQFMVVHRHVPGAVTAEAMVVQSSFRE